MTAAMGRQPEREGWRLSLADLAGAWMLRRRIAHADGTVATLEGSCAFEPDGEGLRQVERGTLRLGGRALEARQAYLWRPGPEVRFADGRAFHPVGRGLRPEARHLCGADVYEVRYGFEALAGGRWTSEWRVRGPRKDYAMTSAYARAAACGGGDGGASKGSG